MAHQKGLLKPTMIPRFLETLKYNEVEGLVTASTDKNGIVTNYTYDKFGNLVTASTPISKALKTTGWSAGMSDAPANALYFEWNKTTGEPSSIEFYDCLGRLLRKVTESVNGKKVYTDQIYDKKGLVERTSEPYYVGGQQYWSKNEYDAVGRTIAQTAPDGSRHIFAYSGLKTTATDPLGSISTKISNLNGLLASSIDNAGTGITYKYDADGKCIETKGSRTTIHCSYDIAGNRISLDDPDLGSSKDTYNGFGELVAHQDGHGETRFEYDTGGRVIQEVRPDVTISTTYDKGWKGAVDEVVSVGSIQSSETYTYDNYGRVIKKNTVIDDRGYETTYTYNLANQVETIKYPKGLKVKNGYDACGIQISVSNADNQKLYWKLHDLDARGQIEKEEYGNGLITTTAHDPKKGTISGILTPGIQNWTYTFDAAGNLVSRRDLKRNLSESFSYDGLYRLTAVRKNSQVTQSITYDNAGNITSKSDVGTYIYTDGSNKLSSITDCKRSIASWDEITYNSFDKVTKIVSGDKTMLIEYGPDKSRVLADIQGVRKYYVDNLFEQKVENGKISSTNYIFVFGKAVAILSQDANDIEDVKYIHHDHLGSIQAYSDELGKLYQELSYDAWGVRRNPDTWVVFDVVASSNAYNDHGFGGHEHIDLFELVNMDGRMYDPVVGRFISADPFIQSPDFTQSLNRYAYCINNPLSLIDPSGYSWFSKNWKSITASIVGIAVSVVTLGSGTTIGAVIIAGAAGGAAGALTGALLNGANIGQIAKSTFMGAFWGSTSGFLNFASGGGTIWEQLFKHTFSQGWMEGIQGGNMLHGFMMGAVSGSSGYGLKGAELNYISKIVVNATVSGLVDEMGGGKFANGAITSAFAYTFNEAMHNGPTQKQLKQIDEIYRKSLFENSTPQDFYRSIGLPEYDNACAARLSYALNKSGIKIPSLSGLTRKGTDGNNYFMFAKDMGAWFQQKWGVPRIYTNPQKYTLKNGVVFQSGFSGGITGHVEYFYLGRDGHSNGAGARDYYNKGARTELWKNDR
jgi:RHS repeat-associated protein